MDFEGFSRKPTVRRKYESQTKPRFIFLGNNKSPMEYFDTSFSSMTQDLGKYKKEGDAGGIKYIDRKLYDKESNKI